MDVLHSRNPLTYQTRDVIIESHPAMMPYTPKTQSQIIEKGVLTNSEVVVMSYKLTPPNKSTQRAYSLTQGRHGYPTPVINARSFLIKFTAYVDILRPADLLKDHCDGCTH